MSEQVDDENQEILVDDTANTDKDAENLEPLRVKVVEEKEEVIEDDIDYMDMDITEEEKEDLKNA